MQLDLPPRRQWDNNNGYCGETSIQQAALYFGTYISQYRAREIIDPTQQQDVWVPDNSGPIFAALGLSYSTWDSNQSTPQYQAYLVWIKSHLQQGHPVIFDVFVQGESDPAYDHIMIASGFTSTDTTTYHTTDTLTFNDNYETTPYTRTFGSLWDTRAMSGNGAVYEYCIPRDTDYGAAVTGIKDSSGTALPVSLKVNRWNEPNISQGASPVTLMATVRVSSVTAGQSYALLRYDDYHNVPTNNYLTSAYTTCTVFTATGGTYTRADEFMSDRIVIYRCVPYTTAGEPFIAGLDATGTAVRLWFDTASGKHYAVEWRNSLTSGSWANLTNNVPGTGGAISITDPAALAQPQRFYRTIETTPP
jgi:hypothetical protein